MNKELLEAILQKKNQPKFDLSKYLFDKQLEFVRDPSPFKVGNCSRRAGKSIGCAADLLHTAHNNPDVICLYVTLSRNNAKKILWPTLLRLNREYALGGEPNETELSLRFPNESIIYLSGAKDASEIEKFRGLAIKKCYIDECQSFRSHIEELIDGILAPALMDHAGSLCLIGTPGPIPSGYFYSCSQSKSWSLHSWNFFDNPFIPVLSGKSHRELLSRELDRRGVAIDDPTIQREWFGKWIMDADSLLLHYDEGKNHFQDLPSESLSYIMGIDIGYVDADAIAVVGWSETSKTTHLIEELVVDKQSISDLVGHIQRISQKYDISKMVMDEGGLGKKIAEEIRRRHQIPVHPADKMRKMENVALLNDALRSGHFKAKKNSRFAQDSFLVEIDRDKSTPDKIRVKDSFHSDIIDAVLYAFKESPAFAYQKPKEIPKWGTPAWAEQEVTEMEQAAEEYFQAQEDASKGWGY